MELTQKLLGLPFFFNKYNSYDCTSYKKRKEKHWVMYQSNDQQSDAGMHSDLNGHCLFSPLTYYRHCTEWHNQWKRSKGVRGKHSQFTQHQQKQSTPPCLGFEVGPGVFGTCQPDVAVFLEKKIKAKNLWHAWCFLVQDTWGRINICFMILTWRLSAILITRCPKIASNAPIKFSCKKKSKHADIKFSHWPLKEVGAFCINWKRADF